MYMNKKAISKRAPGAGADAVPVERTKFTNEFKRMAVERMRQGVISPTELAVELGIRRNQLYKWADKLDEQLPGESFKSPGRPVAEETEVERLRRELATAQEELAILKKFDAYLTRRKQ
jgi:transposase